MAHCILIFSLLFLSKTSWASSCCGQSPASFTVLALNQKLSFSTGVTYLRSQGRVYNESDQFYIWESKKREVRSVLVNLASTLADQHQIFLNTNLLQGHYSDPLEKGSSTNLSDTLIGYTYEILPEYSFSYWKPVVSLTAFLNLPTGHSIYDRSSLSEGTDVTGHGQTGTGLGITVRKVYFPWTLTLQGRMIRLFSKRFERVNVSDFNDSSLAFLIDYSSSWWGLVFNGGLTFTHLSERTIEPSLVTSGVSQNFNILGGIQKSISESWVTGLYFSDQTLLGPAQNTILNRSVSLNFNYNYF